MSDGDFDAEWLRGFMDNVAEELPPFETALYLYLVRHSLLEGRATATVGKRTIARAVGVGKTGGNFAHIDKRIAALVEMGLVQVGETTRQGTSYAITDWRVLPTFAAEDAPIEEPDWFGDPERRRELYERDEWACRYCGEPVDSESATLDHHEPRSKGGTDNPDNLWTACHRCNSIKRDRPIAEAAADLLEAAADARRRSNPNP